MRIINLVPSAGGQANCHQDKDEVFRLLDLPTEMIDAVALMLDKLSLKSLQLVNKDVQAKTRKAYLQICFEKYEVLLCDIRSLWSISLISMHPEFGPALRTLVLLVDELPDVQGDSLTLANGNWAKYAELEFANAFGLERSQSVGSAHEWASLRQYNTYNNQVDIESNMTYLKQAIGQLQRYGRLQTISMEETDAQYDSRGGPTAKLVAQYRRFGILGLLPPIAMNGDPVTYLNRLLLSTNFTPQSVRFRCKDWSINIGMMYLYLVGAQPRIINIQHLELSVWAETSTPSEHIETCIKIMTGANNKLKSLKLVIRNWPSDRVWDYYLTGYENREFDHEGRIITSLLAQNLPNLERLELVAAPYFERCQTHLLQRFVELHPRLKISTLGILVTRLRGPWWRWPVPLHWSLSELDLSDGSTSALGPEASDATM